MTEDRKNVIILVTVYILLYFVGNNLLPITDPVESNYVETAREMIVSGDYFSPRIYDNYWFDKPILFYWELIFFFKIFGFNDFAARLAPTLMTGLAMTVLYLFARRHYGKKLAFIATLMFITSLETWYIGHAVITDMTLLVTMSLTLMSFYNAYTSHNYRWYYLLSASSALAVLDKGPIGLALPGLIILLFLIVQRDFKPLLVKETLLGLILFSLIVSIWYVPMYMLHGKEFLEVFLGVHNVMRAVSSEHPLFNVWYYYFVIFIVGFIPWIFVAVPLSIKKWSQGLRLKLSTDTRFLLIWALCVFTFFELVATKYVTYTFPYMFPVVLLLSRLFIKYEKKFLYGSIATAGVYLILLFTVATAQINKYSAKDIAEVAKPYLLKGVPVYCFDRSGEVVSFTYYTGAFVYDLIPPIVYNLILEKKLDWSVTDNMPKKSFDDVNKDEPFLLFTLESRAKFMQELFPGRWIVLGKYLGNNLYYREKE